MTELFKLGLHEAARKIRAGKLKPSNYMLSLLARIDALDGTVQAWQWLDRQRAIGLAQAADSAATPWKAAHPLHGVPIGVKDNFYTAGIPTEMGGNYGLYGYFEDVLVLDTFYPLIPVYDESGWYSQYPQDNGDHTYNDASFYIVQITAPADLVLASSGVIVDRVPYRTSTASIPPVSAMVPC